MKVLNVNPFINPSSGGGTAERTLQMSYYLAKSGVQCSILTLDIEVRGSSFSTIPTTTV